MNVSFFVLRTLPNVYCLFVLRTCPISFQSEAEQDTECLPTLFIIHYSLFFIHYSLNPFAGRQGSRPLQLR